MSNFEIGVVVVAAVTGMFVVAAGLLGALERSPGLRGHAWRAGSPSRALAVVEFACGLVVAIAALTVGKTYGDTQVLPAVAAATGLLMHAASAFVSAEPVRLRVAFVGQAVLGLSAVVLAYVVGRR